MDIHYPGRQPPDCGRSSASVPPTGWRDASHEQDSRSHQRPRLRVPREQRLVTEPRTDPKNCHTPDKPALSARKHPAESPPSSRTARHHDGRVLLEAVLCGDQCRAVRPHAPRLHQRSARRRGRRVHEHPRHAAERPHPLGNPAHTRHQEARPAYGRGDGDTDPAVGAQSGDTQGK